MGTPAWVLDNFSARSLMDLAQQRLQWEQATASHAIQQAICEAIIFKVKTMTYNFINVTIPLKSTAKVAGLEATNVRSLAEAKALARYETKGIGAAACMTRLTNPRFNMLNMGDLHLVFPLSCSQSP